MIEKIKKNRGFSELLKLEMKQEINSIADNKAEKFLKASLILVKSTQNLKAIEDLLSANLKLMLEEAWNREILIVSAKLNYHIRKK